MDVSNPYRNILSIASGIEEYLERIVSNPYRNILS